MDPKRVERSMLWLIPLGSILISLLHWLVQPSASALFIGYLLSIPIVFSLTVVNLAGRFQIWVWTKPLAQATLVNAGYALLLFFLISPWIERDTDMATTLQTGLAGGIIFMAIGTLNDIVGLENKIFTVYNRAHFKKQGAIASALSYGFYYFGFLGFFYALLAKLGHYFLIELQPARIPFIPISLGVFVAPFVLWLSWLRSQRQRRAT